MMRVDTAAPRPREHSAWISAGTQQWHPSTGRQLEVLLGVNRPLTAGSTGFVLSGAEEASAAN